MIIVEGASFEETEECGEDKAIIPFKFKYLFTKDPCEKCLVKAACQKYCILVYDHWDRLHSVTEWKKKVKRVFQPTFNVAIISFIISAVTLLLILGGCKRTVNQERAEQYYEQHVESFPEEKMP